MSKIKPNTEQTNKNKQANINKSSFIAILITPIINNTKNNKDNNNNNNKLPLAEAIN